MKKPKYYLYLDYEETRIVLESLLRLKNALIRRGRYTDCIDELILKVAYAPTRYYIPPEKNRLFCVRIDGSFSFPT